MLSLTPTRPRSTLLTVVLLWTAFYASFTLWTPPLLDDADSVHVEVAREMLLRHDYVTLYANGIRYLEKAPLLYWTMAASMRGAQMLGARTAETLAAAARLPLALAMVALVLLLEAFARRLFGSVRAGLYAALIAISSFGLFLFTRITIPDIGVCLWMSLAMYALWRTEEESKPRRRFCYLLAGACALNVLTKGLIGVVFPVAAGALYLLATRGRRGALRRVWELHPWSALAVFLLIAAPWHVLAGLANPTQGHPVPFVLAHGHWIVPLPADGNVRGWFWFYFMNEHLLRYLNLRVPHDYDTAPLWLFWGLCLVWMMPWSAYLPRALAWALPVMGSSERSRGWRALLRRHELFPAQRGLMLLVVWAAIVLLFFSLSTRQEYYVLPALPALALLLAGWLANAGNARAGENTRATAVLVIVGAVFATGSLWFLLHTQAPAAGTELAQLLQQNPGDYALSLGHFLDLNAQALGLFRVPLSLAALSLFGGPLAAYILRRQLQEHAANLALAVGALGFLLAAHLGLQTFAPVLTSAQLAEAIRPQLKPQDLLCIHGEYESGSTLGFYLGRADVHILEGRSSNLWYGSFFTDAPPIFETPATFAIKWAGPQRVFLWQSLTDGPNQLPALSGNVYILVKSGGKMIVSNRPNR